MKIAITSPASKINPDYVHGAKKTLEELGYSVVVMPHALGEVGSMSGTVKERLTDLRNAMLDPGIDAVLCSRGGYGTVQLLPGLAEVKSYFCKYPKPIIGFSDITVLHAYCRHLDVPSIHASMAKHLAIRGQKNAINIALSMFLDHKVEVCNIERYPTPWQREGKAHGTLVGGNMAVMSGLLGTAYDMIVFTTDPILFIEDIGEPIYKVERMLWQMRLMGYLGKLKGLVVGQFTDYRPSADYAKMEEMIQAIVEPYGFPVAYNFPIGHVEDNHPLIEGVKATLDVNSKMPKLSFDVPEF